jgi:hypothetical protein
VSKIGHSLVASRESKLSLHLHQFLSCRLMTSPYKKMTQVLTQRVQSVQQIETHPSASVLDSGPVVCSCCFLLTGHSTISSYKWDPLTNRRGVKLVSFGPEGPDMEFGSTLRVCENLASHLLKVPRYRYLLPRTRPILASQRPCWWWRVTPRY